MTRAWRYYWLLPLLCLLVGCGERKEREVELGYQGEARLNPFLAGMRLVQAEGRQVESLRRFPSELDETFSLMLVGGEALASRARMERTLDWVIEGGTLLILLDGASSYSDYPESRYQWSGEQTLETLVESLGELGIEVEMSSERGGFVWESCRVEATSAVSVSEFYELEMPLRARLRLKGPAVSPAESRGGFVSLNYGEGSISVLAHAQPLRNRYLADADHAAFLLELNERARPYGEAVWVYGKGGSFLALLWQRAWRVLLALACLLGLWLWRHGGRFGRARAPRERGHQQVLKQFELSGGFFRRSAQTEVLLEVTRQRVKRQAFRHRPHWQKVEATVFARELAAFSQMPVNEVERALGLGSQTPGHDFEAAMKSLQKLSRQLSP